MPNAASTPDRGPLTPAPQGASPLRATPLKAIPLRGTQSFVGVMAAMWKCPGLTALEVLWRWIVGAPLLWLTMRAGVQTLRTHPLAAAAWEAMTVFQPMAAVQTAGREIAPLLPGLWQTARWLLPLGAVAWAVASTLGRGFLWRRLDPSLPARWGSMAALNGLRSLLLAGTLLLWGWGIVVAGRYSLATASTRVAGTGAATGIGPGIEASVEPNLVLFAAAVVALTLLLFVLWCLVAWPLDAACLFVLAGRQGLGQALRSAVQAPALRARLVEINLVMGIVKVGLAVLAMVFSATPLPFAAEETRGFLLGWWSFVGVLFLLALDFFHGVRRAANLAFFQALIPPIADRVESCGKAERAS